MHLDDRLDDWKAAPLPWEVEMEVDDPEPEVATVDVDGCISTGKIIFQSMRKNRCHHSSVD